MPGLAGLVRNSQPIRNPHQIFHTLKEVGSINGVTYLYKMFHSDDAAILNTLTGLLHTTRDQPASDPTGDVFLFLEGEVYNVDEIKRHSDSNWCASPCDLLLALFLKHGDNFVNFLNGEFNIVIYRKSEKRLDIFSDHIASLPMYYVNQDDCFFFGSEKKFILPLLKVPPTIDSIGLLQIVAHRYNLDNRTFLNGVSRLMPGTHLTYQRGRLKIARSQVLRVGDVERRTRNADLLDEWRDRLREATRLRLEGKTRILISLSAGLDSRAIACAISRDFRPVSSKTWGDDGSLETALAAEIADRLGFHHFHGDPFSTAPSSSIPKIAWRTECETHFTNAISISMHKTIKMHGDFIMGGWLGDTSSGAHISIDMLMPSTYQNFVERAYRRHLKYTEQSLRNVFNPNFLQSTLPGLRDAFFSSFESLKGLANVHAYEIWDLQQRQRRQTTSSMPIDSYLFEKIRPFYDKEYLNFTMSLPTRLRFGQTLYQSMIYRLGPEIQDIPSANNQLRLRRSLLGNLGNKGITLAHRALTRRIRKFRPTYRNKIERRSSADLGLAMRQDTSFRFLIDQFLQSSDFDSSIFNRQGINTMINEHRHGVSDHSYLLGYVATFSAGLPYFLNKTLRCPQEAEPLASDL